MSDNAIVDELNSIVGSANVLTDPDLVAGYVTDWTGNWIGHTTAVVRPADTTEVSSVLAACHRASVQVVPQGGNTGLVGGSIPMNGEIVLSTTRLRTIEEIDPVGRILAAGAGVTVAQADAAAGEHGLALGTDLASRDSATLGGIVSTNAGGVRMIRYGGTRSRVLGVEAVLADGSVLLRWKHLVKDNVGYDLPGLFTGAEGTLGVITRVLMHLVTPASTTAVALVAVPDIASGLTLTDRLAHAGLTLEASELMGSDGIDLVRRHHDLRAPLDVDAPWYFLVEVSGPGHPTDALVEVLAECGELVLDAVAEPGPATRLWTYRESHTESISASSTTPPVKLDVSTPLRKLDEFVSELGTELRRQFPTVRPIVFGHAGDGNVHVNLLDVAADERERVTDHVLRLVVAHGGSISAEHGIGRAKLEWIDLARDATDLAAMRAIRAAFDPSGILNPDVLPR